MKQIMLLLVCVLFAHTAFTSEIKEYVDEYTYLASENDSKITARAAALQQLQTQVLQQHGVSIQVKFENQESLNGDGFSSEQQLTQTSISNGLAKTEIIEEKWDGHYFYIKAKILIDNTKLAEQTQVSPKNCKTEGERVKKLTLNISDPKNQTELIEISMRNGFGGECKQWQFNLINNFREKNIGSQEYRRYLLENTKAVPQYLKGQYLNDIYNYASTIEKLNQKEFDALIPDVKLLSKSDVLWFMKGLFKSTYVRPSENASEKQIKIQEGKQTRGMLGYQLSYLYQLANYNKLGFDEKFTLAEIIRESFELYMFQFSDSFPLYYLEFHKHLDEKENFILAKSFIRYIKRTKDANSIEALGLFIEDIPVSDSKINSNIIKVLIDIHKEVKDYEYLMSIYKEVLNKNNNKLQEMLEYSKLSKISLKKWEKITMEVNG